MERRIEDLEDKLNQS